MDRQAKVGFFFYPTGPRSLAKENRQFTKKEFNTHSPMCACARAHLKDLTLKGVQIKCAGGGMLPTKS